MQLLWSSGKEKGVYDDVLDFTKRVVQSQYQGKLPPVVLKPTPGNELEIASPTDIIQTTIRDLAENDLSLSEVSKIRD